MRRKTGLVVAAVLILMAGASPAATPEKTAVQELFEAGQAAFGAKDWDGARRKLEAAYRLAPDDRVRLLLGRTFVELEDCAQALSLLRAVEVSRLPEAERPGSEALLAAALDRCGGSVEEQKAADLLLKRGRERLEVKQFSGAVHDLEMAQRIAPSDRVSLWLAYAYEASGNCEAALRTYRKIDADNLPADERESAKKRIAEGVESCSGPPFDMVFIREGSFQMGSVRGKADERPVHEVKLDAFYIDRTEVTVVRFAECVRAGGCSTGTYLTHADKPYCNFGHAQREQYPINCVSWDGAEQFCKWAGKRLPTEAEWEYAARGLDGRSYPWGEEPPSCELAVMKAGREDGCREDRTWEVGSRPWGVSEFGVFDMAGNVWEWVADWYAPDAYRTSAKKAPRGPAEGARRVMRGGSWLSSETGRSLRATHRDHDDPHYKGNGVGFRCARDM